MIFIELFVVLGLREREHVKEGFEFQKALALDMTVLRINTRIDMTVLHVYLDEIHVWTFIFAWTFISERTFIQIGLSYKIRH